MINTLFFGTCLVLAATAALSNDWHWNGWDLDLYKNMSVLLCGKQKNLGGPVNCTVKTVYTIHYTALVMTNGCLLKWVLITGVLLCAFYNGSSFVNQLGGCTLYTRLAGLFPVFWRWEHAYLLRLWLMPLKSPMHCTLDCKMYTVCSRMYNVMCAV